MKSSLVRVERGIYVRPSSQTYWIQYRRPLVPGGKRTRVVQERLKGCSSAAQARKVLALRQAEIFVGEHRRPSSADMTLGEFVPRFLASRTGKRTLGKYAQQLRDRFSAWWSRPLSAISRADVIGWYVGRLTESAVSTANNEFAALRALFNEAIAQDVLAKSPCVRVRIQAAHNARHRVLTNDEAHRLERAAEKRRDFMRPLFFLLYSTGARLREVLSLRWAQVDLPALRLTLVDAKSLAPRVVPLAANAAAHLRWWRRVSRGEHVFPSRSRTGYLVQVGKSWRSLCRNANVAGLVRHDLRHNFVSQLQNAGVPDAIVMALTGHRTTKSFQRYSHALDASLRRAVDALPWRSRSAVRRSFARAKDGVKA